MAVMLGGMAAILGFHANVTGNSAQNRLAAAAMSAAQAKLEELRNQSFDDLDDDSDIYEIINPGIGGAFQTNLVRCWSFDPVAAVGDNLLRASVAVVRDGSVCTPGGAALANLTTFIAQADPRIAARNVDIQRRADGDARLVEGYEPPEGEHPSSPSGFELIKEDDVLIAIYNPSNGQALVPKDSDDSLKYAEINGNIIFKGSRTVEEVESLVVAAEGAATCRLFYPDSESDSPTIPTVTVGSKAISYVQYSCIVADQWRRAIYLLPAAGESACVGYPELQPEDEATDILAANARQYYGYAWEVKEDGSKVKITAGIRGATDGSAIIGSVCREGNTCWGDTELRAWVPGGHHFFVKAANESCASAMGVLSEIDGTISTPPSMYANVLYRNPHMVYCANAKDYTNDLPGIDATEEGVTAAECYSTTKLSGFLVNSDEQLLNGWEIRLGSSSRFYIGGCRAIGRFGTHGGGYVCGYGEDVPEVQFTPSALGKVFTPITVSGLSPLDYPHDIVLKNFAFAATGTDTGTGSDTDTGGDTGTGSDTGTGGDTGTGACTTTTKSTTFSPMAKQYNYASCSFTTGSGTCGCPTKVESGSNATYTCEALFSGATATVSYKFVRQNHSDVVEVTTFACP
jgi:hypothetical protein